jgi:hypothetical protein
MSWTMTHSTTGCATKSSDRSDHSRLRALIDEATTDSQDENDEYTGLLSTIRAEVSCPFRARLHGELVDCIRLESPKKGYGLHAICRTVQGKSRIVDIGSLEWVEPLPQGFPWIEAYFAWHDELG